MTVLRADVIFFGSAPATFTVKNITLASGQTNLKLTSADSITT